MAIRAVRCGANLPGRAQPVQPAIDSRVGRFFSPVVPSTAHPITFNRYPARSEEHTSELQSLMRISYAVFCLKKKKKKTTQNNTNNKPHDKTQLYTHRSPT